MGLLHSADCSRGRALRGLLRVRYLPLTVLVLFGITSILAVRLRLTGFYFGRENASGAS